MTFSLRCAFGGAACALLLAFMLWGLRALPAYGHYPGPYGDEINRRAPGERKLPNAISAVNFDYRGADTLGEEFILFAAVAGITMLLRHDRERTTARPLGPAPGRPPAPRSEAVRAFSAAGVGLTIAFGTYLAIHPHLTPGGGFQGAAILAGFTALTFLGLGYDTFARVVRKDRHEMVEAIGAGAYAVIGLATLVLGGSFLINLLPLGNEGQLFAAGTIPLINLCVAVEVFAGFALMFLEFTCETREEEPEGSQA
jgi:multicomponent Na+:H+ antiporter subunit B